MNTRKEPLVFITRGKEWQTDEIIYPSTIAL